MADMEAATQGKSKGPVKAGDAEMLSMLRSYDGFCFDLDGTIWKGSTLIPGAKEVLDLLRAQGKKLFFITNNSSKSRASYVKKMTDLGLVVKPGEVFGSSYAAAVFLSIHDVKKAYVIGEAGIVEELAAQGITALGGPADSQKAFEWVGQQDPVVTLDPEVTAVVVGVDRSINYYKLQTAMSYLRSNKAIFVATNMDSSGNLASEQQWAGAGTMVSAVACASEMEPFVVGKPNSTLMELVTKASGIPSNKLCVVGDRLDTDIQWAKSCGAGALLVLTGCTSPEQVAKPNGVNSSLLPLVYVDSIADLLSIKDKVPTTWGGLDSGCSVS